MLKKIMDVQKRMVCDGEKFSEVEEKIDIKRLFEVGKEFCESYYRYNFLRTKNDIRFELYRETDTLFNSKKLGNQCVVGIKNYFFEEEEYFYLIIGITGVIATVFITDNKINVIKRSEYNEKNKEYFDSVIEEMKFITDLTEVEITEIEETDETRLDLFENRGL